MESDVEGASAIRPAGFDDSPLAGTVRRLNALDAKLTYRLLRTGESEPPWQRLTEVMAARVIVEWHAALTARTGDRRVAASYLGGWIASGAVRAWVLPVVAENRLALVGSAGVAVRRHAEGWLDGVAVAGHPVAVLPGDPAAGMPGAEVVADHARLLDALAERLLAMAEVFGALRAAAPVGLPALWGGLADAVAEQALWLADLRGRDRLSAWPVARGVIERVAARQPLLRQRPRILPVESLGGDQAVLVRGTCCLYYRTVEHRDPDGDGYCETCPLRTDASRARRLYARLGEWA